MEEFDLKREREDWGADYQEKEGDEKDGMTGVSFPHDEYDMKGLPNREMFFIIIK